MFSLLTAPVVEPLTLLELKTALRIDHTADDSLIADMAITARTFVERRLDIALLSQAWTLELTEVPCHSVALYPGPVMQISSVDARYGSANPISIETENYDLIKGRPDHLRLNIPASNNDGLLKDITVIFIAGKPNISDVSSEIKRAISLLTAHYYEEREVFRQSRYVATPLGVEALLEAYRELRL